MTDYHEEQNAELEALESIFCEELQFLSREPVAEFSITLKSEHYDEEDASKGAIVALRFSFTPTYPDEPPEMTVDNLDGLIVGEDEESSLMEYLEGQAQDNLGMVMIFTLASAALEWLNQRCDQKINHREEEEKRKEQEREEEEHRRFEGTRVTVETFMKWKLAFDEEILRSKKVKKEDTSSKKLTGRELFIQDKTMNESDLKFLEEGGEGVKVDESLFENLDELDLDDLEESEDA
ncbi:unnamed protein product [Notodromas monacha]|uniref:RWD domain-containing protein n=1 Tax=Notodromas monacha TaxID=399045 RepID=A0A7R9BM11_9CRUS|nr:unnamed protein product [Notodromas monacha]CAG0917965.1 unnamed protein product [Notodromas monacha]